MTSAPSAAEVNPVPPRATRSVTVVALMAMPRVEVAMAVAFAVAPVAFPTSELAATVWNFAYVTALAAMVVVREPAVVVTSLVSAGNCAAASVPVTFARFTFREDVATQLGLPVVYELVRKPPVLVASVVRAVAAVPPMTSAPSAAEVKPVPPRATRSVPVVSLMAMPREEVATKVGTAEAPVAFARTGFAAAAPKDVTLLPEEVTAPERLALVVTVAALPPMLREEVAAYASAVPSAFE